MNTSHIVSAEDLLKLLKKTIDMPTEKEAFIIAFKASYPVLSEDDRTKLLRALLEYVDSFLEAESQHTAI